MTPGWLDFYLGKTVSYCNFRSQQIVLVSKSQSCRVAVTWILDLETQVEIQVLLFIICMPLTSQPSWRGEIATIPSSLFCGHYKQDNAYKPKVMLIEPKLLKIVSFQNGRMLNLFTQSFKLKIYYRSFFWMQKSNLILRYDLAD